MGPATQTILLHLHVACPTDGPYRKPVQQQQQHDTNLQYGHLTREMTSVGCGDRNNRVHIARPQISLVSNMLVLRRQTKINDYFQVE